MKRMLAPVLALLLILLCGCTLNEAPDAASPAQTVTPTVSTQTDSATKSVFVPTPTDPEPEPEPSTPTSPWGEGSVEVQKEFERISGAADAGMTCGQELLLLDFMERYYQSIADFEVVPIRDLFADEAQTTYHRCVWETLCTIRQAAPEDLTITSYSFSAWLKSLKMTDDNTCQLTLFESSVVYFKALGTLPSEQWNIKHDFTLVRLTGDHWVIAAHKSDDNPYYSADYNKETRTDDNLPVLMENIRAREDQREDTPAHQRNCNNDYDRDAALDYMLTYSACRNPAFMAFDESGGNCMSFGSQVLMAGGIPADGEGDANWHNVGGFNPTVSFINVGSFLDYAEANRGYGLVARVGAPYFTGEIGDIITMGVTEPRNHTTVICGILSDENGSTVDYLLCSNTANLRNYPAAAYYYTNRQLTKIYGWND